MQDKYGVLSTVLPMILPIYVCLCVCVCHMSHETNTVAHISDSSFDYSNTQIDCFVAKLILARVIDIFCSIIAIVFCSIVPFSLQVIPHET